MSFWEIPIKFWQYFQVIGTLSVLVWGVTIWLMVRDARSIGRLLTLGAIATVSLVVWLSVDAFDYGGLVFALGWIVFGTALLICAESRCRIPATILIGSVLAWHLATVNSSAVSDIRARPSEVAQQAAELQRKANAEVRSDLATPIDSEINFGGADAPPDGLDTPIPSEPTEQGLGKETPLRDEVDAQEESPPVDPGDDEAADSDDEEDSVPAYRRTGKVERARDKRVEHEDLADAAENAKRIDQAKGLQGAVGDDIRMMEEDDVYRAQAWDRANLFVARLLFLVVVVWVVFDYLRRFNVCQSTVFPLPIASRTVDSIAPKDHATWLVTDDSGRVPELLELSIRKRETFLCFAQNEPCASSDLPRTTPRTITLLAFGLVLSLVIGGGLAQYGAAADWRRFYVGAFEDAPFVATLATIAFLALIPVLARLPVLQKSLRRLRFDEDDEAPSSEFVLESLWFDRYCFTVVGESAARAVLQDLVDFLEMRTIPDASVRQSVNVVWNFPAPPDEATLTQILFLVRKTNFRLVVSSQEAPDENILAVFDEVTRPALAEPEPEPEFVESALSGSTS